MHLQDYLQQKILQQLCSSASENDDIIGSSMKDKHKNLKARHRSQSIDLKKQKELTEDQEKIVEKQKNMLLGILNACEYVCMYDIQ